MDSDRAANFVTSSADALVLDFDYPAKDWTSRVANISGDFDTALTLFEKARLNDYDPPALTYKMGYINYRSEEFDDAALIEAEERYRDYVALYPGSAEQEGIGLILEDVASQRAAKESTKRKSGKYLGW